MIDISTMTEPDSTQVNAEDFLSGPRTVEITDVRQGNPDQPVNIDLAEFPGRAYRPGKSMRRVLLAAWGKDASSYIGRRMTLYCDPDVKFGGQKVGGIRIRAMSHLDKPLSVALTVTRGQRAQYRVEPLADPEPDYDRVEQWAAKHEKVDALQGALTRMQAVDTDRARAACAVIQARISELSKSGGGEQ